MNRDDAKTFFLIVLLSIVILIMVVLGTKMYIKIMEENESPVQSFEGNSTRIENTTEENKNNIVGQGGDALNQITSADDKTNSNIQPNIPSTKKYFYDQLDYESKIIYDKLASNKENLKTGTYKLDFGDVFSNLLSQEDGSEQLQIHYQSAIECFLYDNPDVFYIEPTKMYINIQTTKKVFTTTYNVYIDAGSNANYLAEGYTSKEQIDKCESEINQALKQILNQVANKSDYDKLKIIHDYLVDNITYEQSISKNNIYNIYGAIVKKQAVCEGYAKAFKYLTGQAGIECVIVIGTAIDSSGQAQNHAWNYVQLDGVWYAVDTTWDDPILIGGGKLGKDLKYKYFLKGSTTMDENHTKSEKFIEKGRTYTYPTLSERDY